MCIPYAWPPCKFLREEENLLDKADILINYDPNRRDIPAEDSKRQTYTNAI